MDGEKIIATIEVIREYLSEDELTQLPQVRDVFLFSCYTGLAFIDVSI